MGCRLGLYWDETLYYYITNLQGDVIRIIDTAGATICTYTYDAWGRLLNSSTNQIFKANPIRYRGYYYDTESGLYYLGSRYYDPAVKRFINADGATLAVTNSGGLTDKNYFAYCDNNPVSRSDDGGEFWNLAAGAVIGAAISAVSQVVGNVASGEHWSNGVLVATASGAASGALAAPGVGRLGQTNRKCSYFWGCSGCKRAEIWNTFHTARSNCNAKSCCRWGNERFYRR